MTRAPARAASTVVELDHVPGLGGLFARGTLGAGRLALARRTGHAPRTLPPVTMLVRDVQAHADHLTAYQHLLGESASDVLPAGFVHVLAFPVATALMVRADFPLPLPGLVHVANRVEQHRPVRLGERLDVRAAARDLRPHRRGTQVDLVTEVLLAGSGGASGDGTLVWRGTSTYLAKNVRLALPGTDGADGTAAAPPPFAPPVPTGRWRLAADTGRRYAAVSGDHNPIHLSSATARLFGFPRTVAHGMYTAARALADVGAGRGERFVWTVELARPVLLPGTVTTRVARDGSVPGPGRWTYAGWDARTGRPHLTGTVAPLD